MYEKERERRFQYELVKTQVDFEFQFAYIFAVLAILFGLFAYYRDNPFGMIAVAVFVGVDLLVLRRTQKEKERRFKEIRKRYIESYWD